MTNPTAFRNNKDIPHEMLLGFLTFNHLDKDIRISKDDLEQKFKDEGLDRFLPELALRDHDVFRRATSGYQNHTLLESKTEKHKLMIRETDSSNKEIIRSLVKEVVAKGEEPQYEVVGSVKLERNSGDINYAVRNANADVEAAIQEMKLKYDDLRTYHDKNSVNNIVTRIVNELRPVTLMPNGRAKFIPVEYNETLEGLKAVLNQLGDSTLELIPLIDTDEQRDLVHKGISKQTESELNSLIYEVTNFLNGSQELTGRKFNSFQKRVKQIEENISYYENVLSRQSLLHQGISQLKKQLLVLDTSDDTTQHEEFSL